MAIAIRQRLTPKSLPTAKRKASCWCRKPGKCCITCAIGPIGRAKCEECASPATPMERFLALHEFEPEARERLPHAVYEYVAGGAG